VFHVYIDSFSIYHITISFDDMQRALAFVVMMLCSSRYASFVLQRYPRRYLFKIKNIPTASQRTQCFSSQPDLITSSKSNSVKKIQSLLLKRKKRSELGQTIVEGPKMIFDLLQNPKTAPLVQQVVVSTDKPEWTRLLSKYNHLHVCEGTPEVLEAISDTVTPQGIVATVNIPSEPTDPTGFFYLILDGVSDPGNVGTLLRSSVAVGVAAVVLLPGCCDVWNPKAVRSAMGSSFLVPIMTVESFQEAIQTFQRWNIDTIYAATMPTSGGDASLPYFDVPWNIHPCGLIIGSEGSGLSEDVRDAVACGDVKAVHVPMKPGIESLNAAVCGSVILFEYSRQCHSSS
jgi:TrmH family RNA methyltransferase